MVEAEHSVVAVTDVLSSVRPRSDMPGHIVDDMSCDVSPAPLRQAWFRRLPRSPFTPASTPEMSTPVTSSRMILIGGQGVTEEDVQPPRPYKMNKRPFWIMAILQLVLTSTILGLAIAGYVIISRDLQTGGSSASNDVSTSPALVNTLFIAAILLLSFGTWKSVVKIVRLSIYPIVPEQATPVELRGVAESKEPGRITRFFFGNPPPRLPSPTLPDYESALRQSARQTARRRAAELGVFAGRRGREQFGTGDPEDLEVERVMKLGGLPPLYRSSEMRKSTVLLRGKRPEGRLSILSLFSNHADNALSPTTPTGRIGSLLRSIQDRFSSSPLSPPLPQGPFALPSSLADEKQGNQNKQEHSASIEMNYVSREGARTMVAGPAASRPRKSSNLASLHSNHNSIPEDEATIDRQSEAIV